MITPNKHINSAARELRNRVLKAEPNLIEADMLLICPPYLPENVTMKNNRFVYNILYDSSRFDVARLMIRWIIRWDKDEHGKRYKHKIMNVWQEGGIQNRVNPVTAQIELIKNTKLVIANQSWCLEVRL